MNVADSQRISSALEEMGYSATRSPEDADVIILNTCVVRQSAENKAYGRLSSLKPLKDEKPNLVINLMGCLVGVRPDPRLIARFPYVDVFSAPSDPLPLIEHLVQKNHHAEHQSETARRFALMDGDLVLPGFDHSKEVCAYLPVVLGCSHACTYCVIPYRRGVEESRPFEVVMQEARNLVANGVKEITLLGQIVDRYGLDLASGQHLPVLLRELNQLEGLDRIRFLTSHPNWMTEELLQTVAELPKVCPHIEVPVQAGDNAVLANMKRGYTREDYIQLVGKIRQYLPEGSIATDIIVGFPGETEEQFQQTYDLLEELRLDVVHLARYSSRPNTVATRRMKDDVPEGEKMRRFRLLEKQQECITGEINQNYLNQTVEVLFEAKSKKRWRGRTPTNKLVFAESSENLLGKTVPVKIFWTGPWSMIGEIAHPGENDPCL